MAETERMETKLRLAGQTVMVRHSYPFLRKYAGDYLEDSRGADVTLTVEQADVAHERAVLETETGAAYSDDYLETVALFRKLGEWLPHRDCMVCHSAAIRWEQGGYLFAAPSGTGKSTHIRLWRQYLGGGVEVLNGDKPILSVEPRGIRVHGSPWAGKEGWQHNLSAELRGICFLRQAGRDQIRRLSPEEGMDLFIHQIYLPTDRISMDRTLDMMERILGGVPLYLLECGITEEAVRLSFRALTGGVYKGEKT